MAVRKQPINFTSISEPILEFKIDDNTIVDLEHSLNGNISDAAQAELEGHCLTYLREKQIACQTQNWKEVEVHLIHYQKAAKALKKLSRELSSKTDASRTLRRIIDGSSDGGVLNFPIRNPRSDLVTLATDDDETILEPLHYTQEIPSGMRVKLNASVLSEVEKELSLAVARTERLLEEYSLQAAQRKHATPMELLIKLLTLWAKKHKLRYSSITTKDGGYDPSAFSNFVVSLMQCFPAEYRETKHKKAGGMAAKIIRTRTKLITKKRT